MATPHKIKPLTILAAHAMIPPLQVEAARFSPGGVASQGIRQGIVISVRVRAGVSPLALFFKKCGRCVDIKQDLMINEEIRDREVRVVGDDGEQLGVMPIRQALTLAEEKELDLVKIVANAQPPVCKLMDYDKYRFEQAKKQREIRKNQKVIILKEVQLSATIEENDVLVKAKNAVRFLEEGNKVKVSIRFRGRQITHTEIGTQVMENFLARVADAAILERRPLLEGRHMIMILAPKENKDGK